MIVKFVSHYTLPFIKNNIPTYFGKAKLLGKRRWQSLCKIEILWILASWHLLGFSRCVRGPSQYTEIIAELIARACLLGLAVLEYCERAPIWPFFRQGLLLNLARLLSPAGCLLVLNSRMTRRSDGEEEVALVDVANAAASSLFSPNMWVRRPSRTPRADHNEDGQSNRDR